MCHSNKKGIICVTYLAESVETLLFRCASKRNLVSGRITHALFVQLGNEVNIHVANALIRMYGKSNATEDAQKVFDSMPDRDVITWNRMIEIYAKCGPSSEAVYLFEKMTHTDVTPNRVTVLTAIFSCANHFSLQDARKIHSLVAEGPFETDIVVRTALVNMYGKCNSLQDAKYTFQGSSEHDMPSFNAMICVFGQHGFSENAFQLFSQMQQQGLLPNTVSMVNLISTCANKADAVHGKRIHAHVADSGLQDNIVIMNALINMYGKCNNLRDAHDTFYGMKERDVISWNAIIVAQSKHVAKTAVFRYFCRMLQESTLPDKVSFISLLDACCNVQFLLKGKHVHSYVVACGFLSNIISVNALINMYGMCNALRNALSVFAEIHAQNKVTFLNMITACINHEALSEGMYVHMYFIESGLLSDVVLNNALVNLYSKCGRLHDAQNIFHSMAEKNVTSWTSIISAHSQHGQGVSAIELFQSMQKVNVKPNEVTFLNILAACSYAGLVEESLNYLQSLILIYGLEVNLDHYHCIIDLLGRSGRLNDAENILNYMPLHPIDMSWMILLGACKKQLVLHLAEMAARHVIELDPGLSASYILLSHIQYSETV